MPWGERLVVGASVDGIQMRSGQAHEAFGPPPVGFNNFGWMIDDLPAAFAREPVVAYFSREAAIVPLELASTWTRIPTMGIIIKSWELLYESKAGFIGTSLLVSDELQPWVISAERSSWSRPACQQDNAGSTWDEMSGLGSLVAHRPTCVVLVAAGGLHLGLTAAGLPGWQCPFRNVTGLPCPGCGLTRASVLLLSGQLKEAVTMHAFAPALIVGLGLICAGAFLPSKARDSLVRVLARIDPSPKMAILILGALLTYWIGRLILDARV